MNRAPSLSSWTQTSTFPPACRACCRHACTTRWWSCASSRSTSDRGEPWRCARHLVCCRACAAWQRRPAQPQPLRREQWHGGRPVWRRQARGLGGPYPWTAAAAAATPTPAELEGVLWPIPWRRVVPRGVEHDVDRRAQVWWLGGWKLVQPAVSDETVCRPLNRATDSEPLTRRFSVHRHEVQERKACAVGDSISELTCRNSSVCCCFAADGRAIRAGRAVRDLCHVRVCGT